MDNFCLGNMVIRLDLSPRPLSQVRDDFLRGLHDALKALDSPFVLRLEWPGGEEGEAHAWWHGEPPPPRRVQRGAEALVGRFVREGISSRGRVIATNRDEWTDWEPAEPERMDLPAGLERLAAHVDDALRPTAQRKALEVGLVDSIRRHFAEASGSLLVSLEGPPGSGKSTFARAVARSTGLPAFRVINPTSKYAGETAARITAIFRYLAEVGPAIAIWDEIDGLGRSRADGSSDVTIDHGNTIAALLNALDHSRVAVLATTNHAAVLDPALASRVRQRIAMPGASGDERRAYLRAHLASLAPPLPEGELAELVAGSEGCSFRDLRLLCERLPSASIPSLPRSVEAWRLAFDASTSRAGWSARMGSQPRPGRKIWHLTAPHVGSRVLISSKADTCSLGCVAANGHLEMEFEIRCTNDVNAACLLPQQEVVVCSTDDGVTVASTTGSDTLRPTRLGGWVWDTEPVSASGFFVSLTDDRRAHLWRLREGRSVEIMTSLQLKPAPKGRLCIHHACGLDQGSLLVVSGEGPEILIIEADARQANLSIRFSASQPKTDNAKRGRSAVIAQTADASYLALPAERETAIWQLSPDRAPRLVQQLMHEEASSSPCCAFDQATGRLAIALKKGISIYSAFLTPQLQDSATLPLGEDEKVTALCFAQYGRVLVWGTEDGQVFTAVRSRP